GDTYFYTNPLEAGKDRSRWVWHDCPCCPPMFLKLMGAMPGYIYATDEDSFYINLFVGSQASTTLKQTRVTLEQRTRYPWDGAVKIDVSPEKPTAFNLMVRIPEWCRGAVLRVNGQAISDLRRVRGYACVQRMWKPGDMVELLMPMPVETVRANPLVQADAGKVALMRGPLVYCLESADNGDAVRRLAVQPKAAFNCEYQRNLLKGVVTVRGNARVADASTWREALYAPARSLPDDERVSLTAIPYYANANRGPVEMTVWLPEAAL
ncbi:MAG: glycoside hydrolase family 127 protein, partial [Acidobacteriaceae bacterium]|nr:glycoside hydrolase family 127 protein [Acidobacteriaceae bacterium]